MQIKNLFFALTILFSFSAHSYECKSKKLKSEIPERTKAYQLFREMPRQNLVEGLLFEITPKALTKENVRRGEIILSYLEATEINPDQRAFFKLLQTSTELESAKPKALKLDEVCDIMKRVNQLKEKN